MRIYVVMLVKITHLLIHMHPRLTVKDEVCYCTKKIDLLKNWQTWMESVSVTMLELYPPIILHHRSTFWIAVWQSDHVFSEAFTLRSVPVQ